MFLFSLLKTLIQFSSLLVVVVAAVVVVTAAISGSWENKKLLTNCVGVCVCVFVWKIHEDAQRQIKSSLILNRIKRGKQRVKGSRNVATLIKLMTCEIIR